MKQVKTKFRTRLLSVCCILIGCSSMLHAQTWTPVGTLSVSVNSASLTSVANDGLGNPWVAYMDAVDGITVKKFSGGSWSTVGNTGFTSIAPSVIQLVVDAAGTPYVMTKDNAVYPVNADFMVWTLSGGSWQLLGGSIVGTSLAVAPVLPIIRLSPSGVVYVAYSEWGTQYIKYFSGGSWQNFPSLTTATPSNSTCDLVITSTGDMYLAYMKSAGYQTVVAKYSGGAWSQVGSDLANSQMRILAVDATDKVYLCQEYYAGGAAVNTYFAAGYWDALGGSAAAPVVPDARCMTVTSYGVPYVAVNQSGAMVRRYNSTSWETMGASISVGSVRNMSINAAGDGIYMSYADDGNGGKVSVVKLAVAAPVMPPKITSVSPGMGQAGLTIAITGTDFDATAANNTVYFGATKTSVISASTTALTARVPAGATYEPVTVNNTVTGMSAYAPFAFMPTYNNSAFLSAVINFDPRADIAAGNTPRKVAIGDMDGDGKADLVVVNLNDDYMYVYRNISSSGTLTSSSFGAPSLFATSDAGAPLPYMLPGGSGPQSVSIGDIDLDGKLDVAVTNLYAGSVTVLRNTSTGSGSINFAPHRTFTTGSNPDNAIIRDLDGDGIPDLAVGNTNFAGSISLLRGTSTPGTINFATQVVIPGTGGNTNNMAVADLDGDKKPELVVSNYGSYDIYVFLNTCTSGTLSFASPRTYATGAGPKSVALGDIDGDGKTDVVTANTFDNKVSVLRNSSGTGALNFDAKVDFSVGAGPISVALSDINGDGKADIVTANKDDGSTSILRNTSSAAISFASSVNIPTGMQAYGVAAGDLDGDDKPDLVVANSGNNNISIMRNAPLPSGPDVSDFSLTTATHTCRGNSSAVTINSSTLIPGTSYTVNYSLTGANPGGPYTSAAFTYGSGSGSFAILASNIPNLGNNTVIINFVTDAVTSASSSTPATNNTANFIVDTYPFAFNVTGGGQYCTGGPGAEVGLSGSSGNAQYSLYNSSGLVMTVPGTYSVLNFGPQATTGTYSVVGVSNLAHCSADMSGNVTVQAVSASATFTVTGGGNYCSGGAGVSIGLNGSTVGVPYKLYYGSSVMATLTGTGSALDFGLQSLPGSYDVIANDGLSCSAIMPGNPTVNIVAPSSAHFVTGGGSYCSGDAGIAVGLDGSDAGASYTLYNGATPVSTMAGTGNMLDFGLQMTAGAYTVVSNAGTSCSSIMTGSVTVSVTPASGAFTVTGGGAYCAGGAGAAVGLSGSTAGAVYTLHANGSPAGILPGTGSALDFGNQTAPGTYTIEAGAGGSCAAFMTGSVTITINPPAPPITGNTTVTVGGTTTLSNSSAGGAWSSVMTAYATVNASTGVVTGVAPGIAIINYLTLGGCTATTAVTVNSAPPASNTVCAGQTVTMSNGGVPGGTWMSGNGSVATVGTTSGVATGVGAGTVLMYYTQPSGTIVTTSLTVKALNTTILASSMCQGQAVNASNNTLGGGVWSTTDPGIASVSATGAVTGTGGGTTSILFTTPAGCVSTKTITVKPSATISGALSVCVGQQTMLSTDMPGGAWGINNAASATVTSAGIVKGLAAGTPVVTYVPANTCWSIRPVTVNALSATTGLSAVCAGQSIALSNATAGGGVWSSSNTNLATVTASGVVTGAGAGTAVIRFVTTAGCETTKTVTVGASATLSGTPVVCVGQTTMLSNSIGGGTWSSSHPAIASVTASGVVTGSTSGTARISYSMPGGCAATVSVTVSALSQITGAAGVCTGQTVTMLNGTAGGGVWSSSNSAAATVSTGGVVSGAAGGNTVISFTTTIGGCIATKSLTVSALPVIGGVPAVCIGQTTQLSSSATGGTWSSNNGSVAAISGAGLVTGIGAGATNISYNMPGGCSAGVPVTVSALQPTTGGSVVCQGQTLTLGNSTVGGGVWSSSNTLVATVSASGVVTGTGGGSAAILFTAGGGCVASKTVTVNGTGTISGTLTVCKGQTTTLSSSVPGGNWGSTNGSAANVSASGVVSGVGAGTTTIIYLVPPANCFTSVTVTVNALQAITGGTMGMCSNNNMMLSNTTPGGGAWSSSNTTIATVSATGMVRSLIPGTAVVSFTAANGCVATRNVTVNSCRESEGVAGTIMTDETAPHHVQLFPNPNTGVFVLTGSLGTGNSEATVEVVNMLGQVIYEGSVTLENGILDHHMELSNNIAHGSYLLRLRTGETSVVIRFVVSK